MVRVGYASYVKYEREKTWAHGPNLDDFHISLWI